MITVHVAEQLDHVLRTQGRSWQPSPGDRFVIPGRDLDDVFVVAEMTIEVEELATGRLIRFNGTTEWALDSIPAAEVLWLPWEHQLRDLLGERFVSLERVAAGFAVTLTDGSRFVGDDAEAAYARALLGDELG
ncbi:MAG TPA: hypothetical protein VD903_02890 [Pseudonocardia sp.]|nr:hypothetical protein [Pseudonocardia sp.]